jgi:hypothetical protein
MGDAEERENPTDGREECAEKLNGFAHRAEGLLASVLRAGENPRPDYGPETSNCRAVFAFIRSSFALRRVSRLTVVVQSAPDYRRTFV